MYVDTDEARLFSRLGYEDLGYDTEAEFEDFDPAKFIVTPVVGVIAGIMAARYVYTYAQTVTWLVTSGFMLWIEYAGKSIVRRSWK